VIAVALGTLGQEPLLCSAVVFDGGLRRVDLDATVSNASRPESTIDRKPSDASSYMSVARRRASLAVFVKSLASGGRTSGQTTAPLPLYGGAEEKADHEARAHFSRLHRTFLHHRLCPTPPLR
jgi:hypothetical protein